MAPGAVRQEPRQGRDQLGWLEQVVLGSTGNGCTWQEPIIGGDIPGQICKIVGTFWLCARTVSSHKK